MAKKCAIIPKVRNTKNELVDSKLYTDLLKFTSSRKDSTNLYLITKNTEFQKQWDSVLSFDENKEPLLGSLLSKTNLGDTIKTEAIISSLNRELDSKKSYADTTNNLDELADKAISFNNSSSMGDKFVATVNREYNPKSNKTELNISAKVRTPDNTIETQRMEYNQALNKELREILNQQGVSIGALTELEKRRGISGVADFSKAKDASKGIVELIRLAEGNKGEQALPEEFAHFAIEAMGNNPLVNRLISLLDQQGLVQEILGEDYNTYDSLYNHDKYRLAKEAAGKLLSKHLLEVKNIEPKPYKNLLERVISSIKNFLTQLNASSFQKAIIKADKEYGSLAKSILNGEASSNMDIGNITTSDQYYSTKERIERDRGLLKNIIKNELKRLKIYEKRNPDSKFSTTQRLLIDKLELSLANNSEIEGIYDFLSTALEDMTKVETRLKLLKGTSATDLNGRASILRDIRNYIYSYTDMVQAVREALREEQDESDNRYGERVKVAVDQVSSLIKDLDIDYNTVARPLFTEFIRPFFGEDFVVRMGKNKGEVLNVDELILKADEDIGFFDRWLDSMADSSDYMLKVMDQAVKKSKDIARLNTVDFMKKIQALGVRAEQDGIKDTEWLFEKDSKGNKTGNYITPINHGLFKEAMSKMFKEQREKYGKIPTDSDQETVNKERRDWFNDNMELVDGQRVPKMSKYGNKDYKNLSAKHKQYHKELMEMKEQLDALLPDKFTKTNNAIKIRKDLMERVKASKNIKGGMSQLWESAKDQLIRRTDDTDFEYKSTLIDFEGREVETLPIFYTSMARGEKANDISTDIVGTFSAYAAMAYDFSAMNKVIDVLEVGRDLMRERKVYNTSGGKPIREKFKVLGKNIENKLVKKPSESNFIGRLDDFFTMQVYNKYMKDEGTVGKTNVDWGKLANLLNRITSVNNLALNTLSGISNIATGSVMMRIESFAGEFFNQRDTTKADLIYGKELPKVLGEMGNRVKTNKLNLFSELFNTMQEFEQDVRDVNFDRKTWFSRMFNSSALFFINNAGEHWMQNRTVLALANATKLKDKKGNKVSLWDAMEVVYTDPNNKALGAKLKVREGYTKEDGTEFSREDIGAFTRKAAAINQRLHGIYNKADRSAIQRTALGRLGMMFRKWMKPSLNRRFKSASKNFDLDAWTEGYYITTFNFMKEIGKDLKNMQLNITTHWDKLDKREKRNIGRALTELAHFLAISLTLVFLDWDDDEELDSDRSWASYMTEYQLRRLYTELGALAPTPAIFEEGFRILKSPAAAINTADKLSGLMRLLNWNNYEFINGEDAIIKSGAYEGKSRATQVVLKSPLAPIYNTMMRNIYVQDQIPFFKQ